MLGRTDSRARLLLLLVAFVFAASAIVARLAYWQIVRYEDLSAQARAQTALRTEEPTRRGAIYDRSGVVVLATTVERSRLVAAPRELDREERRAVGDELATILELDAEATAALRERLRLQTGYTVLAHGISPEAAKEIREAIADGRLVHLSLEPEPSRVYPQEGGGPNTTLASHLLGFVNRDGVGQYGVEQYYQDLLAGSPRVLLAQRDVNARPIPETAVVADPGVQGADLRLTIDAGLQLAVEQELLAAWIANEAISVSAVIMDPYTGEVYAHASYPSYDANDYREIAASDPSRFIDPIVTSLYEPGSVFKFLTVVAGLEQGVVQPDTEIQDVGTLRLDGGRSKIDNADRSGRGWMRFRDAIASSRNVVAAKVALGLAETTREASALLHEVWTRLGFGRPTGIDVAGEAPGLVRDPTITKWREIDLANGSFGQGVAVTPIQLASAYAAMMNGGRLVRPHVVAAIGEEEVVAAPQPTVIEPALSRTLVDMMNHVVTSVKFYANGTLIPGYYVGGKTGTAQIWDSKKKDWKDGLFNYSFVGYVGRQEGTPELVVALRINEAKPSVARVGHLELPVMSFELFRRLAHDAIATPGLLPAGPRGEPIPDGSPGPVAADR